MSAVSDGTSERVLVLAPTGRDGALAVRALSTGGIEASVCESIHEVGAEVERGAGALLVAEEALDGAAMDALISLLDDQPAWSDLPLLLFTSDTEGAERLLATVAVRANVTILQRPTRTAMLVSTARAALRARARQYQARDLVDRLIEADRQKDEFLATISHELRTPLNAMVGWTRIVKSVGADDPLFARGIETIERSVAAQTQLIEDLLDVARIVSGQMRIDVRPMELLTVVEKAVEMVRPTAALKQVRVQTVLDPRAGPISGDPERLQQVVWNLLTNAIKFTPKGGRVQVDVARSSSHVELTVADTGIGMNEELASQVFDRFHQADGSSTRRYSGLGLGLSIVRHIVELHAGTVGATSDGENRGSTFTVRLPVNVLGAGAGRDTRVAPSGPVAFDALPSLDGVKVMVVEDHPDAIDVLAEMLKLWRAEVRIATRAKDALEVLSEWQPDVLVSDIGLPDEDGIWLIDRVRAADRSRGRRTPAVAVTAFGGSAERTRTLMAGFQQHLVKPVEPAELCLVIASLAGRT